MNVDRETVGSRDVGAETAGSVLVTGAAGFIGYHLSRRLLERGQRVVGIDDLNDYYDVGLKEARLARLLTHERFQLIKMNVANHAEMQRLFADDLGLDRVVHLAARAGVRYSSVNPHVYAESNLVGFLNILEGCRQARVGHLLYASSSAVYGQNSRVPFSVRDHADHPLSLYAATKKANELMAHSYAHLYQIPCTGLRFFTVYGPWGRPDMALFSFTRAILAGLPIPVFNRGEMYRDFTYIDDLVEAVVRLMDKVPEPDPAFGRRAPDPATSSAPYRVYNIGNQAPVHLLRLIEILEETLGKTAEKQFLPMQPGDIPATYADVEGLVRDVGFRPDTPIEVGVQRFVAWYRDYYGE